ncbi:type II/IV secretion system protein, partial [Synechocystis salina LEGE 00041]|nr:type II/IV secretion system protein [Synechocystis salina LEGE 00041]
LDLMAELQALEDLSAHKKPKVRDRHDQNITVMEGFDKIEELLIDELEPSSAAPPNAGEETFIAEEETNSPEQGKLNPFKSVIDPW